MTRYAIIQGGVAVNIVEADASFAAAHGLVAASQASIGDLWNGATFSKPVTAPAVPQSITPRQFRQSLTHFGFRSAIESAIAAADQDTKDWYQFATSFERASPVVATMAQALGFTSTQVDAVWLYAATL